LISAIPNGKFRLIFVTKLTSGGLLTHTHKAPYGIAFLQESNRRKNLQSTAGGGIDPEWYPCRRKTVTIELMCIV